MINKLPKVGDKFIYQGRLITFERFTDSYRGLPRALEFDEGTILSQDHFFNLKGWGVLQEKDGNNLSPSPAIDKVVSDEVERMNRVVMGVDIGKPGGDKTMYVVRDHTGQIIYSGEENPMSKNEAKIDMKKECVDSVKTEKVPSSSIWKDVSELPKYHCQLFVKFKHHNQIFIYDCDGNSILDFNEDELDLEYVESFCILTDFINQHEDLLRRVEKLEEK